MDIPRERCVFSVAYTNATSRRARSHVGLASAVDGLNEMPGIWVRPTPAAPPALTLFGSTNLNSRSADLDTELSFVLATTDPALQQRLGEEVEGLREHGRPWRGDRDSDSRKVTLGTRALVSVVGGML